jgi:hypothetical protein
MGVGSRRQLSGVVNQIPDVFFCFHFPKYGHATEPDAIVHNPEQFTVGVSLRFRGELAFTF